MKFLTKFGVVASALFLTAPVSRAEEPKWYDTTDHFAVHGLRTDDYGDFVTVAIEGTENHYYMAYNLDIIFPAGVTVPVIKLVTDGEYSWGRGEVFHNMEDGIYPTEFQRPHYVPTHKLDNAVKDFGTRLKVICFSTSNDEFLQPTGAIFDVFVKVHPLAKAGVNTIKLKDMVFNTKNHETGYPIQWAPGNTLWNVAWTEMTIPAERTVEISITAADKWAELILPFALSTLPEGVKAYEARAVSASDEIELYAVDKIEPYMPYIIYAPEGWTATLTGTASEKDFPAEPAEPAPAAPGAPDNMQAEDYSTPFPADAIATNGVLQANIKPHKRTDGYVFTIKGDAPAFTRVSDAEPRELATGDVFIPASDEVTADALPLKVVSDEPGITGIESVVIDNDTPEQPVYNLQGIRIDNPLPGQIYISRGHKFRKL